MATIRITDTELVIEMHGMDKFWALRSSLTVPLEHIRGVDIRPKDAHAENMKAFRVGSYMPGYVLAGYYYMVEGVGVNATAVFESLERAQHAIEAWPVGKGSPRDPGHRENALEHVKHAVESMRSAAHEMGIDPSDKGKGWAFYEVHDPTKTIGIDLVGEKMRRVVIEVEGQTPEEAATMIEKAARAAH
jgi:hypothetical protein